MRRLWCSCWLSRRRRSKTCLQKYSEMLKSRCPPPITIQSSSPFFPSGNNSYCTYSQCTYAIFHPSNLLWDMFSILFYDFEYVILFDFSTVCHFWYSFRTWYYLQTSYSRICSSYRLLPLTSSSNLLLFLHLFLSFLFLHLIILSPANLMGVVGSSSSTSSSAQPQGSTGKYMVWY